MPANRRQQTTQSPTSPTAQNTAKYTNKDGSKFITVPKVFGSTDSPEPSPAMAQTSTKSNSQTPQLPQEPNGAVTGVNRKKQKRRQKQAEAAQRAAGQSQQTPNSNGTSLPNPDRQLPSADDYERDNGTYDPAEGERAFYSEEDGDAYSGSYEQSGSPANGYALPPTGAKTSKKKGKGKAASTDEQYQLPRPGPSSRREATHTSTVPPPLKTGMSKEKIWNTSSQEERERIKLFWLSLGEEERRSLVKVEKDAVLKKMKEQQKHSCSCTVCGRKRVAIEEELEVLYDAYYEELEQYANNQQGEGPPPIMAASRRFGPMGGLVPPNRLPPAFSRRQPSRGKIVEHFDNEDDEDGEDLGDEEYSEDDYISDEDPAEEVPRSHATDFFNFGQSLTVQGGILTVADDLLKNDGKKFIEMMEQLAERRMAREEDAKEQLYSNSNGYPHPSNGNLQPHSHHGHNHPPPADEEDYDDDEEEEDEYDSQDDDYDEEEMDTMTEEQRMEEGRRMFQIFAARMFEQRVLTAYKEKVAAERQEKLIQELDEENMAAVQKKAKKAKDAQKKKEKAQQKKLALAEEKSKREAEKAAEEAASRAAEEKKAEEARLKADEKRKKREAQKKAEEEERARKEAEKQRRLQEQRERQAEIERKAREAKERERREKEEFRQKEKEAREAKEREARERKEKQEREKREVEAKVRAEKEASEQQKRQEQAAQQATTSVNSAAQTKRPHQQISIPMPAGLHSAPNFVSPHVPVATPVLPKAPTPNRPSTTSQRDPTSVPQTPQFGKSQSTSPNPPTPQQSSPGPLGHPGKAQVQQPFLHHPQATSPIHAAVKGAPSTFPPGPFPGMQPMGMNGFLPGMPMMAPGYGGRMHHEAIFPHPQPLGNQFRALSGPNGMPMHPNMSNMSMQQGRGFPVQHAPPGFPQQLPNGPMAPNFGQKEAGTAQTHSRQQSASYEKSPFDNMGNTQPIARPGPIGRPSSVVHGQRPAENSQPGQSEIDDLSNQLGSSALLDDSDDPMSSVSGPRHTSAAPGGMSRQPYSPHVPFPMDHSGFNSPLTNYNTWTGPQNPFGASALPGNNYMAGWGTTNITNFGAIGGGAGPQGHRPGQPRSIAVRQMLCTACKNLEGASPDGFHSMNAIREQIERLNPPRDEPVSEKEILDLCETEGNPNNGGGYFDVRPEGDGRISIRFEPDIPSNRRSVGAPGDIGSPVVGSIGVSRFPGPPGIATPGGI